MGPWFHGQEIRDGSSIGAIELDSDTAKTFRRQILAPFLAQYLKDGAPKADVAPVTAFETGTNAWRRLSAWPAGCAAGCSIKPRRSNSRAARPASRRRRPEATRLRTPNTSRIPHGPSRSSAGRL
jgi:predicted acyl esterase